MCKGNALNREAKGVSSHSENQKSSENLREIHSVWVYSQATSKEKVDAHPFGFNGLQSESLSCLNQL